MKIKNLITVFIITCFFSCNTEKTVKVTRLETFHKVYFTAEYSETVPRIDFDGSLYVDTDYWSEKISDEFHIQTETSIYGFNTMSYSGKIKDSIHVEDPIHSNDFSKSNFDRIERHEILNYKAWYDVDESEETYVNLTEDIYKKISIGDSIIVGWTGFLEIKK